MLFRHNVSNAIKRSFFRDCVFEKAYILYRQCNDQAALDTLAKAAEDDLRCLELKAQLFYRSERFEEAANIFKFDFIRLRNLF